MVTASSSEDVLVWRIKSHQTIPTNQVEDGTCAKVVSVKYRVKDTSTQEEAGIWEQQALQRCLADEQHPGGQDKGAGDGGQGLDEDGQGEVCPGCVQVHCVGWRNH